MDYDVILYVLVIRMAGGIWELQKLFGDRCYFLPCFHSPYGTYKAIVGPSVGTSNKTSFKTRHVEQPRPHNTPALYIGQVRVTSFSLFLRTKSGKPKFVKTNTYKHKERKITQEPVEKGI